MTEPSLKPEYQPLVFASGMWCPEDGGGVQAIALLLPQPGNESVRIPTLRLLCHECDWQGSPSEAMAPRNAPSPCGDCSVGYHCQGTVNGCRCLDCATWEPPVTAPQEDDEVHGCMPMDCPDCDGDGVLDPDGVFECKRCDGSGSVTPWEVCPNLDACVTTNRCAEDGCGQLIAEEAATDV